MLNGTLCATERALCCLVENYQTPEVRPDELEHGVPLLTSYTGLTNSGSTPAIYARPRLPSLGERIAEESTAKTGSRMSAPRTSRFMCEYPLRSPLIGVS